jgi:uncharacterized membrane protein
MPSEILYNKRSPAIPSFVAIAIAFACLSLLGLLDSAYLTAKYFSGTPIPCSILNGCQEVINSPYSAIGPIPVALLGGFYYLVILVLTVGYIDKRAKNLILIISSFTVLGLIASTWFVYLQVFVIKAICMYCMLSALTSTIMFILGMYVLKVERKYS